MDAIHPARRKKISRADLGRLGGLAHFTARHRWLVIGVWIVLTVFGGVRGREALLALVSEPLRPRQAGV